MKNTTTSSAHTPGPWKARSYPKDDGGIWIDSDNWTGRKLRGHPTSIGGTLATAHSTGTGGYSVEANARLIAAAPELLRELKRMVALANRLHAEAGYTDDSPVVSDDEFVTAQRALDQAEGTL